ncbi:MAG: pentapeptide repeat-containing protein, partial [Pseudomonadota bacterium]
ILAAVVGAPFVVWRSWLAGRQVQINREGHYTDLFTKAVEQLGATKAKYEDVERRDPEGRLFTQREQTTERNMEVRLGAIYALERVMKDSTKDAGPIVETLSSYIKENCEDPVILDALECPKLVSETSSEDFVRAWKIFIGQRLPQRAPGNRADLRAALAVLCRRNDHPSRVEFEGSDPGIMLDGVNFQGTDLIGSRFDNVELRNASFDGAFLSRARLRNADLFESSFCGAILEETDFDRADLTNARFLGSDLYSATFRKTKLSGANFMGSVLRTANFDGAFLRKARLTGVDLYGASLVGADLSEADFSGSNLRNVYLDRAILIGAKLSETDLSNASFYGAFLKADFSVAKKLPRDFEQQVQQSFGNKIETPLPKGVSAPEHWFEGSDPLKEQDAWEAFKRSRHE